MYGYGLDYGYPAGYPMYPGHDPYKVIFETNQMVKEMMQMIRDIHHMCRDMHHMMREMHQMMEHMMPPPHMPKG